jgi:hypothetical protein
MSYVGTTPRVNSAVLEAKKTSVDLKDPANGRIGLVNG